MRPVAHLLQYPGTYDKQLGFLGGQQTDHKGLPPMLCLALVFRGLLSVNVEVPFSHCS